MYHVYCDGACRNNPSIEGSYAFIVLDVDHKSILYKKGILSHSITTNNQMELSAAIAALEYCSTNNIYPVTVYSDSNYVVTGITKWIAAWKIKKYSGVKNVELWKRLDTLNTYRVNWQWVKAHNGDEFNTMVDQLCNDTLDLR